MLFRSSKLVTKNALPILAYYDIFKNYYANTQEENFYIIGNTENLIVTINGTEVNPNVIPSNEGRINNTGVITISPNTIKQNEVQIKAAKDSPIGQSVTLTPGDIGTWEIIGAGITIKIWEPYFSTSNGSSTVYAIGISRSFTSFTGRAASLVGCVALLTY